MYLFLYLIMVSFSVLVMGRLVAFFINKNKENGIEILNYSKTREIMEMILLFIKVSLPIINIIYALYILVNIHLIYQKKIAILFLDGKVIFHKKFGDIKF